MSSEVMTLEEIEALACAALRGANTSDVNAQIVARSTRAAERDGIPSHGLNMLALYCQHSRCGKVDGHAEPVSTSLSPTLVRTDARDGFAHPAIAQGFETLIASAHEHGLAGLAVTNSYNCGVLGYHTERLAASNLLGLGFTNAPASMAPVGGKGAVVGTNPLSLAVPDGAGGCALLIDQSSSVIAKSEIVVHAAEGKAIPEGWALDKNGQPTTDPKAALAGTMLPTGGVKGFGQGLLVEIMAAALTSSTLGQHASSFGGNEGGPPRTGQYFLAIDPARSAGAGFQSAIAALIDGIESQAGARRPGARRLAHRAQAEQEGVAVKASVLEKVRAFLN